MAIATAMCWVDIFAVSSPNNTNWVGFYRFTLQFLALIGTSAIIGFQSDLSA
jgi:hypothetical protein